MVEIIPSINVQTFEEVWERVKKIEPHTKWCHLDVTDGIFSKHLTWHDPRDLHSLQTALQIEVHLMVENPEKLIEQWLIKPIRRAIVHLEAMSDPDLIIKKCRTAGVEVGFAVNPETFWGKLKPWFKKVDMVQVLTVHPGPSGQSPDWPLILGKIKHIRTICKKCNIEADGGINPESAKQATQAGADLLVAGNYIFSHPDLLTAMGELRNINL